jgi:hypothetical protein
MTVEPHYDPESPTVDIDCTFAYTADTTFDQVVWTMTVTDGWTIGEILGLPSGWTAGIVQNPSTTFTITFNYSASRSAATSNYFSFAARTTYTGGGDPGRIDITTTSIQSSFESGDPVNTQALPAPQASEPQTATLDVNGSVVVDSKDCVYIYRYVALGKRAATGLRPNAFYELGDGVTIEDVEATVTSMVDDLSLDVNGSGVVDSKDCVYIYRYVALGKRADSGLRPNAFYELGAGVTVADVQANIEALYPSE